MASRTFGDYFKGRRVASRQTLRAFCLAIGFDPGNISKLERGRLPPPHSQEKLASYAKALKLKQGSDEWIEFFDRAAASRGELPKEFLDDEEVLAKLPVLFRTIRGQRTSRNLDALVEKIRRS